VKAVYGGRWHAAVGRIVHRNILLLVAFKKAWQEMKNSGGEAGISEEISRWQRVRSVSKG
jgi:hypothetical protein